MYVSFVLRFLRTIAYFPFAPCIDDLTTSESAAERNSARNDETPTHTANKRHKKSAMVRTNCVIENNVFYLIALRRSIRLTNGGCVEKRFARVPPKPPK